MKNAAKTCPDMAMLLELTEETVLDNLITRYSDGEPCALRCISRSHTTDPSIAARGAPRGRSVI